MEKTKTKKIANDQFYTKKQVAEFCCEELLKIFSLKKEKILEPSAGTGVFVDALKEKGIENIEAYDIEPKHPDVKYSDFYQLELKGNDYITVGNPPFGKRSKIAIDFFNKCSEHSKIVAFILPVQFKKYGVQSKLNKKFKLIKEILLKPDSFENNGKDLFVRCCFQIWARREIGEEFDDLRIKEAPPTKHKDFEMYIYNNTKTALKFFDYDWDFAVFRQGFYDYSQRIFNKKDLNSKIQYLFFKAKDKTILKRLLKMDYEKLSLKNTTIKGFGKADVVEEYKRLYENER